MKKSLAVVVSIVCLSVVATAAMAEQASWMKSAGQMAVQAGVQALNPQAQAIVNEAMKLAGVSQQENFIVTKAKTIIGQKNFETALQLATYVMTNLNSKSLDAQKIATDAKAALAKMAQDKLTQTQAQSASAQKAQQVQSDAQKTTAGVKGLLGSFGTK